MVATAATQRSHSEPCRTAVELTGRVKALEDGLEDERAEKEKWRNEHERRQDDATRAIIDELKVIKNSLINRLPLWATLMFTTFMGVIGFLLGVIYFLAAK